MRRSRVAGLCALFVTSQALVGCGDDAPGGHGTGGSSSGSSTGGKASAGETSKAGSSNNAGSETGGNSGSGGTGGDTMAGTAGTGGGVVPACTMDAMCNDNNPCTDDTCTDGNCVHENNTADCDDGNECTDDKCDGGSCKGTNNTAPCDDANECTSDDACAAGTCKGTNNTDACDDGNVCTSTDTCTDGACKGTNNTEPCDDLSACTTADVCAGGLCNGTRDTNLCPDCDDGKNIIQNCDFTDGTNHWAEGFFDGAGGTQMVTNERLLVDISNSGPNIWDVQPRQEPLMLKQGSIYDLRIVAGASVDRDMVISLTHNVDPYTVHTPGDFNNQGYTLHLTKQMKLFKFRFTMTNADDALVKLEMKIGTGAPALVYIDDLYVAEFKCTAPADCSDGNVCTDDVCNVDTGACTNPNNTAPCAADADDCTNDVCAAGACTHPVADDDTACTADADNCTADVCTSGICTHEFDTNACDCVDDTNCDDDNVCTDDDCNAGSCEYTNNAVTCDDDEVCTSNDVCDGGVCAGTNNTDVCDDGKVCTSNDVCGGGVCAGTNNTDVCDDGNPCTVTDMCGAGACAGSNVCFDCRAGGNLLTNCDLSDLPLGTGWLAGFFDGAAGTQAVANGMLKVDITAGGQFAYMVQPRQEGIVLAMGTTYTVKFNAMASKARKMVVSLTQNGGGYVSYSGQQPIDLTTEMKQYTFEFTMNAVAPNEKVKLEFDLGDEATNPSPSTVYLDNLFLAPKP